MVFFLGLQICFSGQSLLQIFVFQRFVSYLLSQHIDFILVLLIKLVNLNIQMFLTLSWHQLRYLLYVFILLPVYILDFCFFISDFLHQFLHDFIVFLDGDHYNLKKCILLLLQLMKIWYNLLILIYIALLALFYRQQFHSYPQIQAISNITLIDGQFQHLLPKRVLFIVIDALRYDYLKKMTFVDRFRTQFGEKSFIVKCKVGNPTMTTQRIQSLMTGSEVFSSSNILSTFLAAQISIDNIITQLNASNKSSIVFGDDTWIKLFDFSDSKTCANTYDVNDISSCDETIYKNLQTSLKEQDHSFVVAHFLALDHVGHSTSSISNEKMNDQIQKISTFLSNLIEGLDEQTFVLVTGDHGMRQDGNHGGNTRQEVQTFLFGLYKKHQLYRQPWRNEIQQSDITATLSILLNVNIPSNSIGFPILKSLPKALIQSNGVFQPLIHNMFNHIERLFSFYGLKMSQQKMRMQQYLQLKERRQEITSSYMRSLSERLTFLTFSLANSQTIAIILILLTIVLLSLAVVVFRQDITNILDRKKRTKYLVGLFLKICFILPLFVIYCSWNLMKNMSNIMLILACIMLWIINKKLWNKNGRIISYLAILCLSQLQPIKINEYKNNAARIELLHHIFGSSRFNILLFMSFYYLYMHKLMIEEVKTNKITSIMIMIVVTLTLFNYMAQFYEVDFYYLRVAILITSISLIVKKILADNCPSLLVTLLFGCIFSLFVGKFSIIIFISCYWIVKVSYKSQLSSFWYSFVCQLIWWLMGFRYEYSGIDIIKSYIFSAQYDIVLNSLSLWLYMLSPHLLMLFLMNLHILSHRQQIVKDIIKQEQGQQSVQIDQQDRQLNKDEIVSKEVNYPDVDGLWNAYPAKKNIQFSLMLCFGVLSSAINVFYNNQKILFTVVYVPLLFLTMIKTISIIFIVIFLNLAINKVSKKVDQQKM